MNPGYMVHVNYWDARTMEPSGVEHKEAKDVCASTITYTMDGDVGRFANLALLAQAVALARDLRILDFLVCDNGPEITAKPDVLCGRHELESWKGRWSDIASIFFVPYDP